MAETLEVENATIDDALAIKELLQVCDLPIVNIEKQIGDFIVAKQQKKLLAILGAVYDDEGNVLLRSFAVREENRRQGIGEMLIRTMLEIMTKKKITKIFLLTETADAYFSRMDFNEIQRTEIPDLLLSKSGLDKACPCSSKCFIYNNI